MSVRKFSTASIKSGVKSSKFWDQTTVLVNPAFESIATVSVGSGGATDVQFTSIPGTYKHLQIRAFGKTNRATYSNDLLTMRYNSDTGSNYYSRIVLSNSTATATYATHSGSLIYYSGNIGSQAMTTNNMGMSIITILDYADTNKFKTMEALAGFTNENTGTDIGIIAINTGVWRSTSAITSITLDAGEGSGFQQYSHFALYGIKGVA